MTPMMIFYIALFLGTVFTALGFWHRAIQRAADGEVARAIAQSEKEGANQALTQHPQIDIAHCMGCGSCVEACPEHGVLAVVEGKARLVRASHCVGHGCCEIACPVGALTVGLGDVSARDDIPLLSDGGQTSVPGIYIAGELGGIGLIRNAVEQGRLAVDAIAEQLAGAATAAEEDVFDLLIVGCGPAGIAAALRAHERKLKFVVVDQDGIGGSVRKYPRNKMTLTQPVDLPVYGRMKQTQYAKEQLIDLWESVFDAHRIPIRGGIKFEGLEDAGGDVFVAATSGGPIKCRKCLLSLGRRGTPRKLDVPGEDSERVLYQLIDAADYTNQHLLVVGGGDSAIEAALALASQRGNTVTLSYRRSAFFRIKTRNRERLESQVGRGRIRARLNSRVSRIDEKSTLLETESGTEAIPTDFVFVMAGGEPPYPLLKNMGIRFGGGPKDERAAG